MLLFSFEGGRGIWVCRCKTWGERKVTFSLLVNSFVFCDSSEAAVFFSRDVFRKVLTIRDLLFCYLGGCDGRMDDGRWFETMF